MTISENAHNVYNKIGNNPRFQYYEIEGINDFSFLLWNTVQTYAAEHRAIYNKMILMEAYLMLGECFCYRVR